MSETGEDHYTAAQQGGERHDKAERGNQSGLCTTKVGTTNRNLILFLSEDIGDNLSSPELRNEQMHFILLTFEGF